MYDTDIFRKQYPLAKEFIYHLTYYRFLNEAYSANELKSVFWQYTINSHLLQATVKWCKIFGSNNCNDTHWKRLTTEPTNLQRSFRDGLKKSLGINQGQWDIYWTELTDFRNKYIAHSEIGFIAPVPSFDMALNIVFFYDTWVREIIKPDYLAGGSLKLFSENLAKKIEQPLYILITESAETLNGI